MFTSERLHRSNVGDLKPQRAILWGTCYLSRWRQGCYKQYALQSRFGSENSNFPACNTLVGSREEKLRFPGYAWSFQNLSIFPAQQVVQWQWPSWYAGRERLQIYWYIVFIHFWIRWQNEAYEKGLRLRDISMLYSKLVGDLDSCRKLSVFDDEWIEWLENTTRD